MSEFIDFIRRRENARSDEWFDMFTPADFSVTSAVVPAKLKWTGRGRAKDQTAVNVIATGSTIEVPDNVIAVLLSHGCIEKVITKPGLYTYRGDNWEDSSKSPSEQKEPTLRDIKMRRKQAVMSYQTIPEEPKQLIYVNLREINGLPLTFQSPVHFHDKRLDADIGFIVYGTYSLRICNPVAFLKNFAVPKVNGLDLASEPAQDILLPSVCHAVGTTIASMNEDTGYGDIPMMRNKIYRLVKNELDHTHDWKSRLGLQLTGMQIEQIRLSRSSLMYIQEIHKRNARYEQEAKMMQLEVGLYSQLTKEQAIAMAYAHGAGCRRYRHR